ncbi:hypothetical protein C8N37_102607 [Sphingobacterium faecium]|nr:hypothetical protein C8N37_102607 [Sphingobacterium faecium]
MKEKLTRNYIVTNKEYKIVDLKNFELKRRQKETP